MLVGSRDRLRDSLRTRLGRGPWQRLWAWLRGWHGSKLWLRFDLKSLGFGFREQKDVGFECDLFWSYGFPISYPVISAIRREPRRQTEVALSNEFHNLVTQDGIRI
jgi:hypothetical protein